MIPRTFRSTSVGLCRPDLMVFSRFSGIRYNSKTSLNIAENFWEKLDVKLENDWLQIEMGGKALKSPNGNNIRVPANKKALAHMIANEWSNLASLKLKNYHIPLTSLAARALDVTPEEREKIAERLLPFLDTDTLLVIAPRSDCEGKLRASQLEKFPPVVADACEVWGIDGLQVLDQEKQLFGNYQTPEAKAKVLAWVKTLDNWQFASFERATTASRSFIIGMNAALARRPVEELAALASLDVTHQTDIWGEVEDTHDVDKADIRRLLGAAYINAL